MGFNTPSTDSPYIPVPEVRGFTATSIKLNFNFGICPQATSQLIDVSFTVKKLGKETGFL